MVPGTYIFAVAGKRLRKEAEKECVPEELAPLLLLCVPCMGLQGTLVVA